MPVLLAEAETISTTSQITYFHRHVDCPSRTHLMNAIDFVRQVAVVKRVYLDRRPQFWRDGYRPFLLRNVEQCFLRRIFFRNSNKIS